MFVLNSVIAVIAETPVLLCVVDSLSGSQLSNHCRAFFFCAHRLCHHPMWSVWSLPVQHNNKGEGPLPVGMCLIVQRTTDNTSGRLIKVTIHVRTF